MALLQAASVQGKSRRRFSTTSILLDLIKLLQHRGIQGRLDAQNVCLFPLEPQQGQERCYDPAPGELYGRGGSG